MRVVFSHHLESLADALADAIANRRAQDPLAGLDPITLWLGQSTLGVWLRRAVAERLGLAAHWLVRPYNSGLDELVGTGSVRLATRARLELALLAQLANDELLSQPELQPAKRYLDVAGADDTARDRRRQQFARELAQRFARYGATRPQMLRRWSRGQFEEGEKWQGVLHESVCALGLLPLERLFDKTRVAELKLPTEILAVELPLENEAITIVLHRLAEHTEITCFTLNPCREFWEDELGVTGAPALLTRWGKVGRVRAKQHQELVNYAGIELYEEAETPTTALQALQQDLQTLHERQRPEFTDDSIVRCAAPSVRRELDWVVRDCWRFIERGVRPDKIAVVLPPRESHTYRTHASAAFEEHHGLRFHELDVPLSETSKVLEAVELLLALPMSVFSRADLLRLITHPNVIAAAAPAEPADWMRWCESLSIVQGPARDPGTYVEGELYHWDQGLIRLALGRFTAADEQALSFDDREYLPFALPTEDHAGAAQLIALVRSLLADAAFAKSTRQTVAEWARFFVLSIHAYVRGVADRDEGDINRIVDALTRLEEDDLAHAKVSHIAAAELVLNRLSSLSAHRGAALAEGVVAGPLTALSSIPFEVVYLTGLGEGRFPPTPDRSQLDLRQGQPRFDDVDRREEAQYRFLQRILHTKTALRVSWVGRDESTGLEQAPAPTVDELTRTLRAHYLGDALRTETLPLRRWEEEDNDDPLAPSAARREARVASLRKDMEASLGRNTTLQGAEDIKALVAPEARARLARILNLPQLPKSEPEPTESLSLFALLRFLMDPLDGWTRAALRWSDDDLDDDPFARQEEPFETESLHRARLLREVFCGVEGDLEETYRQRVRTAELAGHTPSGTFGEAQARRDLKLLNTWQDTLRSRRFGMVPEFEVVEFGVRRRSALNRSEDSRAALVLNETLSLSGSTGPRAEHTTLILRASKRPYFAKMLQDELQGFVDHAVLSAAGLKVGPSRSLVLYDDGSAHEVEYAAWAAEDALSWLQARAREVVSESHAYDLRFAAVVALERARTPMQQKKALARPTWGYDSLRRRPPAPSLEDALAITKTRFAEFFRRRRELT